MPADDGDRATPQQAIRLSHATAMVVGTIIGASIFVQPSEITGRVPTLESAALVWIVAGALTLMGALVTAELASVFPETGGVYVFLRESFGRWLGFLWGWAMFWVMHSGIIAAIGMVFASYLAFFLPLGDTGQRFSAVVAIGVLSAVNYVGVKQGSVLQTAFTIGKVLAIVVMVAAGFALGGRAGPGAAEATATGLTGAGAAAPAAGVAATVTDAAATGLLGGGSVSDFLLALVAGLFAFGGWHMVTYQAGETVDARRTVPRALFWGVTIVTVCYVLLNAVYFHLLPVETVVTSSRIAADAADAVMGSGGATAMSALVVFSTFGALAGIVLAGPRVYWAMADDGLLFRWAGDLHPRYGTPHRAILLQAVWASILVMTGTYRALFTRVIYTEWIFFGLMAVGLVLLRRRPGLERDYSVPLYPVLPLVFAAASFGIVIHQIWTDPTEGAIGLLLVLVGLPVFALWRARRNSSSSSSSHPTPP